MGGGVVKKWKMGVFCKKVGLSSTQGALCTVSVFFILHFTYWGVRTQRTPPAYGPANRPPTVASIVNRPVYCTNTALA